jgi:hypothetical protein
MNLFGPWRDQGASLFRMETRLFPWILFAVPLIAVGLGVAFAVKAVSFVRQARACSRWPTVPGKILEGRIETGPVSDDKGDTEFSGYRLLYSYRVDGREYRSTRLYLGNPVLSGGTRTAERLAAKYPPGADVTVYYNSANPAMAMLEPLNLANMKVATVGAIGFGSVGLFFLSMTAMVA